MSERALDEVLDTRVGLIQVGEGTDVVASIITRIRTRIRERFGIDAPAPWWESKDHPDYELVFQVFVQPHRGLVRVADVDADPLAFDQALRELKVCRHCSAYQARVVDGRVVGMTDCPLGQTVQEETGRRYSDGRPETVPVKRGSASWYSDIRRRGDRWEWVMRQCTDPERRVRTIRERLGQAPGIAGSWTREADGEPTPFDRTGGDPR